MNDIVNNNNLLTNSTDIKVGDVIKTKEGNLWAEFIVVHIGLPSEKYDESCDGIWVLRKKFHTIKPMNTIARNNYADSEIHAYLNNEYYESLDEKIKPFIKQVKIPYKIDSGNITTPVQIGVNGLSCKVFIPSIAELMDSFKMKCWVDGSPWSYINEVGDSVLKLTSDDINTPRAQWTRTPMKRNNMNFVAISRTGFHVDHLPANYSFGIRPTFILSKDIKIDSNGYVLE